MSVVVYRGFGNKPGEDITSEVLTTESLQRECGRQAVNETDSDRIRLSGSAVNTDFMMPGSIVNITDNDGAKNGYLEDYAKNVSMSGGYSSTSSVVVEQVK